MNKSDITRDYCMLKGPLAKKGYDWWWHSFTAQNAVTGESKSFYIEYFLCNPALAQSEPVLVWNDPQGRSAGKRPSYCMVNVGFWGKEKGQLHRFFPWSQVSLPMDQPLDLRAGDCACSETHMRGSVQVTPQQAAAHPEWMSDAGEMSWDLDIHKLVAYHVGYGASKFFRRLNAFEMFWHAEGMKTAFSGWVRLNGQEYLVRPETCYGYADKNWGGNFTSPWVWLSSNNLVSNLTGKRLENSVFEVGGGNPKVFGIALGRKLLGQFYYEGQDYEFNFSKFWTGSRTAFHCQETPSQILWKVTQTTFTAKMEVEIACDKSEMLLINYESPDGYKRHTRLWNCGNGSGNVRLYVRRKGQWELLDDVHAESVGCEYGEYEKSSVAR
ncbi:MAG: tocopherol cyclase family protein [Acutalibacter sp.]